jgi:hypothetical protein
LADLLEQFADYANEVAVAMATGRRVFEGVLILLVVFGPWIVGVVTIALWPLRFVH